MKKRFVSLLCALALCLGLLPATALAEDTAPQTLYVGNYQIKSISGDTLTYLKPGPTEGSLIEGTSPDWTVRYEPSSATLTLNRATIGESFTGSAPCAGIYAQCYDGRSVALTIKVIGTNTIQGHYGICGCTTRHECLPYHPT